MAIRRTIVRGAFLLSAVALLAQGGDSARSRGASREVGSKPVAAVRKPAPVPTAADRARSRAARMDAILVDLELKQQAIAREIAQIRARRDSIEQEHRLLLAEHARVARALLKQQLMTPAATVLLLPAEHRRLALKQKFFERYAERQRERAGKIGASGRLIARQDSILRERERRQLVLVDQKRAEIAALVDQQQSDSLSRPQPARPQKENRPTGTPAKPKPRPQAPPSPE